MYSAVTRRPHFDTENDASSVALTDVLRGKDPGPLALGAAAFLMANNIDYSFLCLLVAVMD